VRGSGAWGESREGKGMDLSGVKRILAAPGACRP